MKKFILAVVLAVAPSVAFADFLGCAAGGVTGGYIGSQIGGGVVSKILGVLGFFGGCSVGSRLENGTYGKDAPVVTRKTTVVNGGEYQDGGYGYNRSTNCPAHWEGNYFMEEGYQRSRQSGGITRDGCYSSNIHPAVYTTTTEETVQKPARKAFGPTVHNYISEPMIHPACKSDNPGADGNCLLNKVQNLRMEQMACEGKTTKAICPVGKYNPGQWAGVYDRLGKELIARQIVMQEGEFGLE